MSKEKPSLPKGTRDFGPAVMKKRNFILNTITSTFRKFGFNQIETPSLENLSVLTGKYGEEGDQLLFKVLNSGDYLKGVSNSDIEKGYQHLLPLISNKGLRYDLTVPLARYVVMNQNEITFPFKRFQIQPVWRADKPQKGRYREFLQCDADIIGTRSILCELEIVQMIDEVLTNLNIPDFEIKVNHRQILSALAKTLGPDGSDKNFAVVIDKLGKIGWEKVSEELEKKGYSEESIKKLGPLMTNTGARDEILNSIEIITGDLGKEGIYDIKNLFSMLGKSGWKNTSLKFDPALARGLTYYTGAIFEVVVKKAKIGSIAGGGRYDDLTGIFGLPGTPATGFSFGIDRIYDVMEELDLFKDQSVSKPGVLIAHFDEDSFNYGLGVLNNLRENGIISEMYPDQVKINKQLSYGNKNSIPYLILIGREEVETGILSFKDMKTGDQKKMKINQIIELLQE